MFESIINKTKNVANTLKFEKPNPDVIPYACHYDKNTLLTRNGELLKIIEISSNNSGQINIQQKIVNALSTYIKDSNFAIWIHTHRQQQDLNRKCNNFFANGVITAWKAINNFDGQFINKTYISIVYRGKNFTLNSKNIFKSFSRRLFFKQHQIILRKANDKLSKVCQDIHNALNVFETKILGINITNDIVYSDMLSFLSLIIYNQQKDFILNKVDLSVDLVRGVKAFGQDIFQIVDDNKNYYGNIITIKDYQQLNQQLIDKIFNLPHNFLITQIFTFADEKLIKQQYQYQKYILNISKDKKLYKKKQLHTLMDNDDITANQYGHMQITITIVSDNKEQLNTQLYQTINMMRHYGLVLTKEDLNLELLYWSNLPANFKYIRRNQGMNLNQLALFANVNNNNSKIVDYGIIEFKTNDDCSSVSLNLNSTGATNIFINGNKNYSALVSNLLLSHFICLKPKILTIDYDNNSNMLIKALGGHYFKSHNHDDTLSPNYSLIKSDNKNDQEFLIDLFELIILVNQGEITDKKIVNSIFELEPDNRTINDILKITCSTDVKKYLLEWIKLIEQIDSFNSKNEVLYENHILALNYQDVNSESNNIVNPIIFYLLYQFIKSIDDEYAIIHVNSLFQVFTNNFIDLYLPKIFKMIGQSNIILLLNGDINTNKSNNFISMLHKNFDIKIITSNLKTDQQYKYFDIEKDTLANNQILLKQQKNIHKVIFDISTQYITPILQNNRKFEKIMDRLISLYSGEPSYWLPAFYRELERYYDQLNTNIK